eukprot:1160633-Pelagomonas_calceolata.AAC.8
MVWGGGKRKQVLSLEVTSISAAHQQARQGKASQIKFVKEPDGRLLTWLLGLTKRGQKLTISRTSRADEPMVGTRVLDPLSSRAKARSRGPQQP